MPKSQVPKGRMRPEGRRFPGSCLAFYGTTVKVQEGHRPPALALPLMACVSLRLICTGAGDLLAQSLPSPLLLYVNSTGDQALSTKAPDAQVLVLVASFKERV